MSTVIVDVSNDYVDDLLYSYQLCKDNDGTFYIWVETSVLRGYYAGQGIEDFSEAFQTLYDVIDEHEGAFL